MSSQGAVEEVLQAEDLPAADEEKPPRKWRNGQQCCGGIVVDAEEHQLYHERVGYPTVPKRESAWSDANAYGY